jgi:spore coat protein U-like protein
LYKKIISAAAVLAFALTSAANAAPTHHWAAPSTLRLHVSARVLPSCTFSAHQQHSTAVDLNFGALDANTVGAEQNTALNYTCSAGATPKLALNDNDAADHNTNNFALRSGPNKVNYHIHLNSVHGTQFENSNSFAHARTVGSLTSVGLYAEVPHANLVHAVPGHYSDIVTATLFF